ncbi:MAG: SDR family oxidoreductase [Minicystis sp.]
MDRSLGGLFSLEGKRALVTGGAGVLCSVVSRGLCMAGAHVLLTHHNASLAEAGAAALREDGYQATSFALDVMDQASLREAADRARDLGGIDILINGVGGNQKGATTAVDLPFSDLSREAMEKVMGLNFLGGAFLTSQAFAPQMGAAEAGGVIINITSMSAIRPLTRIPGYSAAKAAVTNFTQWLAVHLAQEVNPLLRVNAVAPGFFLTTQNRFLLTDERTGVSRRAAAPSSITRRCAASGSPMILVGAVVWLCSDAARFVTGVIIPVDGGFSAFSGI